MKCSWISSCFPVQPRHARYHRVVCSYFRSFLCSKCDVQYWNIHMVWHFTFPRSFLQFFLLVNKIVCLKSEILIAMLTSFDFFFKFSAERQKLYTLKNQACLFSPWKMATEISMMSRNILLLDSSFLCTRLVRSL